jgi:hypothetical protein
LLYQLKHRQQTDNYEVHLLEDRAGKLDSYYKKEGHELGRRRSDLSIRGAVPTEMRLSLETDSIDSHFTTKKNRETRHIFSRKT